MKEVFEEASKKICNSPLTPVLQKRMQLTQKLEKLLKKVRLQLE